MYLQSGSRDFPARAAGAADDGLASLLRSLSPSALIPKFAEEDLIAALLRAMIADGDYNESMAELGVVVSRQRQQGASQWHSRVVMLPQRHHLLQPARPAPPTMAWRRCCLRSLSLSYL